MFKKICAGVFLVMMIGLAPFIFSGCNPDEPFEPVLPTPLSEEMIKRIEQDYEQTRFYSGWGGQAVVCLLYNWGTYNGAVVITTNLDIIYEQYLPVAPIIVAGVEFPQVNHYYRVWYEGDVFTLTEAYEQGLLTQDDLTNIAALEVADVTCY